jgi:hypothetical protein
MQMEVLLRVYDDALAQRPSARDFATRQTRTNAGNMGRSTTLTTLYTLRTAMSSSDVHLRIADEDNA